MKEVRLVRRDDDRTARSVKPTPVHGIVRVLSRKSLIRRRPRHPHFGILDPGFSGIYIFGILVLYPPIPKPKKINKLITFV